MSVQSSASRLQHQEVPSSRRSSTPCRRGAGAREAGCAKVRPPVVADARPHQPCRRAFLACSPSARRPRLGVAWNPGRRLRRRVQQVLVEPMSSDPTESHLVGRVDRCDAQSAKLALAGTPARDPRPATRVETSVRTLYRRWRDLTLDPLPGDRKKYRRAPRADECTSYSVMARWGAKTPIIVHALGIAQDVQECSRRPRKPSGL
jgi:hypothetical protein